MSQSVQRGDKHSFKPCSKVFLDFDSFESHASALGHVAASQKKCLGGLHEAPQTFRRRSKTFPRDPKLLPRRSQRLPQKMCKSVSGISQLGITCISFGTFRGLLKTAWAGSTRLTRLSEEAPKHSQELPSCCQDAPKGSQEHVHSLESPVSALGWACSKLPGRAAKTSKNIIRYCKIRSSENSNFTKNQTLRA